ncbi:MAG TPA: glycoside hydrolase family 18 protein [Steroidobacteraceae bacterium]|nr:glycoside hydrolase family 18 protein [Steroidobacteraceae bacterium]
MTFWSNDTARHAGNPMPGSVTPSGVTQTNPEMRHKLDAINVLAYAFLQVDAAGNVYFDHPAVDLSASDVRQFCIAHPTACPHADSASAGSFSAFARLDNRSHTLQKIASISGGDGQSSMHNALNQPQAFVRSAVSLIQAYHLDGIDLDFEPEALFGPGQGERYAQLVTALRQALGERAFISVEVPGDWETLRSLDCPADMRCRDNLALIATSAYVSLMGYEYHGPYYPGTITGNDSNLYSDPDEPLLPRFYHGSDNQAVGYLTFRSVPAGKILLGFPAYFVSYGAVAALPGSNGLYQGFDRSHTPVYDVGAKGVGSYRVAQRLLKSGFAPHRLRIGGKLSAVYAYSTSLKQWISYDDSDSVAAKSEYVIARHLAGLMMWEIGEDVPVGSRQSLLGSAHRVLISLAARTVPRTHRRPDHEP